MTEISERVTFFGLYRGLVIDNNDPLRRGRLRLTVPSVTGGAVLDWAWPCVPVIDVIVSPDPGAAVFVQFEGGDPNYPVWMGVAG